MTSFQDHTTFEDAFLLLLKKGVIEQDKDKIYYIEDGYLLRYISLVSLNNLHIVDVNGEEKEGKYYYKTKSDQTLCFFEKLMIEEYNKTLTFEEEKEAKIILSGSS